MKLRIGFVTNSSSSSFTIAKSDLTDDQIEKIKNHIKVAKELEMETFYDEWDIRETKYEIYGYTLMDNFDMEKFLLLIGVAREDVEWED
jgi:hypothetical protein